MFDEVVLGVPRDEPRSSELDRILDGYIARRANGKRCPALVGDVDEFDQLAVEASSRQSDRLATVLCALAVLVLHPAKLAGRLNTGRRESCQSTTFHVLPTVKHKS